MHDTTFMSAVALYTRRRPFVHFIIETVSGERVAVAHPESVIARAGVGMVIEHGGRYRMSDAPSVCQVYDRATSPKGVVEIDPRDEFGRQFKALIRRRPFIPFRVEMTSGERFVVDRGDVVGHDGSFRFAGFIDRTGRPRFFDNGTTSRLVQEEEYILPESDDLD